VKQWIHRKMHNMEIKNPILKFRELNQFSEQTHFDDIVFPKLVIQSDFTNVDVDAVFVAQTLMTRTREAVDTSEYSY
jgi:hypothetical protein